MSAGGDEKDNDVLAGEIPSKDNSEISFKSKEISESLEKKRK